MTYSLVKKSQEQRHKAGLSSQPFQQSLGQVFVAGFVAGLAQTLFIAPVEGVKVFSLL